MNKAKIRELTAHLLAGLLVLGLAAGLLGCDPNTESTTIDQGLLAFFCFPGSPSVAAGSTEPVVITAEVRRGGALLIGERVEFETARGSVAPFAVFTDSSGLARTNYFPPNTAGGTAIITAKVVDGGEELFSDCILSITQSSSDPLLSVAIQTPPVLAGLAVRVVYDPARVQLPEGGVDVLGQLADNDCLFIVDDDDVAGVLLIDIACPTSRGVAGPDVLRFGFENTSGAQVGAGSFTVTCSGFDERGNLLGTVCTSRVTQV